MCDDELRRQLKFAAHSALKRMSDNQFLDEVPVLMSGAGHDAMAISHLTKVWPLHSWGFRTLWSVVVI